VPLSVFSSPRQDKKPQKANHSLTKQHSEQATWNKNISDAIIYDAYQRLTRYVLFQVSTTVESSNIAQRVS
jgi:hypothetical protein